LRKSRKLLNLNNNRQNLSRRLIKLNKIRKILKLNNSRQKLFWQFPKQNKKKLK
jgi:hypothetical protein